MKPAARILIALMGIALAAGCVSEHPKDDAAPPGGNVSAGAARPVCHEPAGKLSWSSVRSGFSPAFHKGTLYSLWQNAQTRAGAFLRLDATNGSAQDVTYLAAMPELDSFPLFGDDVAFVALGDAGAVQAVNLSGGIRWTKTLPPPVWGFALAGSRLVIGASTLTALSATDGSVAWTAAEDGANPAIDGSTVFATGQKDGRGVVRAFDLATGRLLWQHEPSPPMSVVFGVAAGEGVVVAGGSDGTIRGLDEKDGSLRWTFTTSDMARAPPLVAGGVAFVGSNDHHIYALDLATGKPRWNFTAGTGSLSGQSAWSLPVLSGRSLLVGKSGAEGGTYALDAATGKLLWHASADASHAGAAGGGQYVAFEDGVGLTSRSLDERVVDCAKPS